MTGSTPRDHGGGLDAAIKTFGGARANWLDLSTGINPVPYRVPEIDDAAWSQLPDGNAQKALEKAAREFWDIPKSVAVLAAPGTSSLIAQLPAALGSGVVDIHAPTYNEHAIAFENAGWKIDTALAIAKVIVHPNNPDGRVWSVEDFCGGVNIIDESFCDTAPDRSLVQFSDTPQTIVLKSFGKFWGLAGLRLGFAIGDPEIINELSEALGPWPVSGPALQIGTAALSDDNWAEQTRTRLAADASRLDQLMISRGAKIIGGTTLFRLYEVDDAADWQARLANAHIWTRVFPYSKTWLRLGIPSPNGCSRLESAL